MLPKDVLEKLSNICNITHYKSKTTIYKRETPVNNFIMIINGECELTDSDNKIIRILKEGDFFGLVSILSNSKKGQNLVSKTDITTLELSQHDLNKLTNKYPDIKDKLLDILNIKLFNPEINSALEKIAKGIDDETIFELKKNLSWKTLKDSEILFNENDPGDSCYIIMSGKVQAIKNYGFENQLILGELGRGDIIGDMALITQENRSATIKASKLTRLIYFSKETFNRVMFKNPQALMEVSKALINRLKYTDENDNSLNLVIGVISLVESEKNVDFIRCFEKTLKLYGSTALIDENKIDSNQEYFNLEILIENIIAKENFLILKSNDMGNKDWKSKIVQFSDKIVVLCDRENLNKISNDEFEIFGDYSQIDKSKVCLVINHNSNVDIPQSIKDVKKIRNNVNTYNIKDLSEKDIGRVARLITNNSLGLVLGGGGAKGFAHLGLFKAMNELDIPIDAIGGTSAGSIISAQIALGLSLEQILELNKNVNSLNMFKEYGFPYISLLKSQKIDKASKMVGSNRDIEDMWIPFFAPATDLTNSKLKLFESGPVWEAIRSSGALPGIVLPHFKDNSILVDGGVLNNLPVDIMRKKFNGTIICSSCSQEEHRPTNLNGIPNQLNLLFEKFLKNQTLKINMIMFQL